MLGLMLVLSRRRRRARRVTLPFYIALSEPSAPTSTFTFPLLGFVFSLLPQSMCHKEGVFAQSRPFRPTLPLRTHSSFSTRTISFDSARAHFSCSFKRVSHIEVYRRGRLCTLHLFFTGNSLSSSCCSSSIVASLGCEYYSNRNGSSASSRSYNSSSAVLDRT